MWSLAWASQTGTLTFKLTAASVLSHPAQAQHDRACLEDGASENGVLQEGRQVASMINLSTASLLSHDLDHGLPVQSELSQSTGTGSECFEQDPSALNSYKETQ